MKFDSLLPGITGTYIFDLNRQGMSVSYLCEIPAAAAIAWLQMVAPEANMGTGAKAKDLVAEHGTRTQWLNKLYVLVTNDGVIATALYNHDGTVHVVQIEETV